MNARQTARQARKKLLDSLARFAAVRGDAQWKNGYRCGKGLAWEKSAEGQAVHHGENEAWRRASEAHKQVERALTAYARAIRRTAKGTR